MSNLPYKHPRSLEDWKVYLNDHQLQELKRIAKSPIALEALEKVLCFEMVGEGLFEKDVPFSISNNYLFQLVREFAGQEDPRLKRDIRAYIWGLQKLGEGIENLKIFREKEKVVSEEENPGL